MQREAFNVIGCSVKLKLFVDFGPKNATGLMENILSHDLVDFRACCVVF